MSRHPPAFQVDIRVGRVWSWTVAALVALAASGAAAWAFQWASHAGRAFPWPWAIAAGISCLALAWIAGRQVLQSPPRSLRWDGQAWWLDRLTERGNEERQGRLDVMLDFNTLLLLRFSDLPARRGWPRRSYLAVARADLVLPWHVLRSTIYSARGGAADLP